jgi:hypothetical protein
MRHRAFANCIRGPFAAALAGFFAMGTVALAPAAACELAAVKAAIDSVLDKDAALAGKFKKEFQEGADPFYILDQMVDAETRKKIDVCRFQAAEYLTKRGFPPSH